jgi:outer membrane protein assembly factor BamB
LHRDSGEVIWSQTARKETPHEGHHPTHGFASGSPVTDGQHLWASFGSRGIFCYDLNGAVVWENDLGNLRTRNGFGEGASPVIAGNSLLVLWDQEAQSYLIALDKKTGKELWRTDRDEPTSWTTPVVVEVDGISQAIVAGANKTRSYDTQNGQLIWEAAGLTANIIPTPVVDDKFVYVVSGYKGRSVQAIDLGSKGDVTDSASIAWSALHSAPYVASPVLSGNRLFMNKGNDAYLTCFNAQTGEVFFQDETLEGIRGIYASPISANGHLYVLGKEGVSLVLKDSETFEIVSTNQLDDPIDASPVIVGNDLLIRTHTHLYCISEDS